MSTDFIETSEYEFYGSTTFKWSPFLQVWDTWYKTKQNMYLEFHTVLSNIFIFFLMFQLQD